MQSSICSIGITLHVLYLGTFCALYLPAALFQLTAVQSVVAFLYCSVAQGLMFVSCECVRLSQDIVTTYLLKYLTEFHQLALMMQYGTEARVSLFGVKGSKLKVTVEQCSNCSKTARGRAA